MVPSLQRGAQGRGCANVIAEGGDHCSSNPGMANLQSKTEIHIVKAEAKIWKSSRKMRSHAVYEVGPFRLPTPAILAQPCEQARATSLAFLDFVIWNGSSRV
jgi:hypothetical protein